MIPLVGAPIDRVDGPRKVTGAAQYAAEFALPGIAYGVIVGSSIASGRIARIDAGAALKEPGVIAVMTPVNAPRVDGKKTSAQDKLLLLLQDDRVYYDRQPIAVVIGETFEAATHGAGLVRVEYIAEKPVTELEHAAPFKPDKILGQDPDSQRGEPDAALSAAAVKTDRTYVMPVENHNPMEPHATTASWKNGKLTVYDSTQGIFNVRAKLASVFGIPKEDVRVVALFVGGGFGSKGSPWAHTALAAMAAKLVNCPVKLALARPQMFGPVGFRPRTVQRVALGADAQGRLVSSIHEVTAQTSEFDVWTAAPGAITRMLYAVPNQRVTHRLVRLNAGTPTFMRAPGETPGSFALESAMDELAVAAGIDPLELRLRNYAEIDPGEGKPFSSKSLRECYVVGAEAFGWSRRAAHPRAQREGNDLVGFGMATATYPSHRSPAEARVTLNADGTALVQCGTQDIGTGAYTVFTQVAAETLGMPVDKVHFELGDSRLPLSPNSGGSQTTASVASAVYAACQDALAKRRAIGGTATVEGFAHAEAGPETEAYSMHAFGAQFAEVHVDADLGRVRVTRFVGAFAAGRILNAKTARSQYLGGITWGIGQALMEHTRHDTRSGRVMNANLAEYLVPVNADIPAIDVHIVPEADPHVNPVGVKGIGEIGIVGVAAAIANAVYNATGVRVRELPITPDKLVTALA
jgi:xanthine dehydrogenase YagR molybdenum-binding subunit